MLRWIDTHCHLDAAEFAGDVSQVRQHARSQQVVHCVLPAVTVGNFDTVRALAHAHGDSYALGIHPLFTPGAGEADLARLARALREHADDPRLVAVGEIGLDFFVPGLDAAHQEKMYLAQLKLARDMDLPVILHVRRSADRLLRGLRAVGPPPGGWRGIAHAFNGSLQQATAFVELGLRLGFGGALTFERALQLRRLARNLPLQSLVLETDAPDIAPHWLYTTAQRRAAGEPQGRNQPGELPRIALELAELRGLSMQQLADACWANSLQALPRLRALLPAEEAAA